MRNLVAALMIISAFPAYGAGPAHHPAVRVGGQTAQIFQLDNGSFVKVDQGGFMTMFDSNGKTKDMKDGVVMKLIDGRSLIMRVKPAGVRTHRIARSHIER